MPTIHRTVTFHSHRRHGKDAFGLLDDRPTPVLDQCALIGLAAGLVLLLTASLAPNLSLLAVPGMMALLPSLLIGAR